jgi:hypothetical protein
MLKERSIHQSAGQLNKSYAMTKFVFILYLVVFILLRETRIGFFLEKKTLNLNYDFVVAVVICHEVGNSDTTMALTLSPSRPIPTPAWSGRINYRGCPPLQERTNVQRGQQISQKQGLLRHRFDPTRRASHFRLSRRRRFDLPPPLPLPARIAAPASTPRVVSPRPLRQSGLVWSATVGGSSWGFGRAWHDSCRTRALNPMLRLQSIGERCASSPPFSYFPSVCAGFVAGKVDLPPHGTCSVSRLEQICGSA